MNLFFIIVLVGVFVSTCWISILALQKELSKISLIICGIFWLLALGTLAIECFSGKYDEQYAIYHVYMYSLALEQFKNNKHEYPLDLAILFTQGYMDKKLSGLRYATDPAKAYDRYYFVYTRLYGDFALYAKSLKMKPTFFVDKTGSIRVDNARGKIITEPFMTKGTNRVMPKHSDIHMSYPRF